MKAYLKNILIILLGVSFYSCDKEEMSPISPPINAVSKYAFNKSYNVADLNLFIGEKGEKLAFDEAKAKHYWSNLTHPHKDTIILNLKKDTLIFKDKLAGLSPFMFKMYQKNDSIFILRNNDSYTYFGKFENNSNKFIAHLGFYIGYKPKHEFGFAFERGNDYKLQSYEQRFFKGGWFESPSDMTNLGDTVAWCNVFYTFEKIQ